MKIGKLIALVTLVLASISFAGCGNSTPDPLDPDNVRTKREGK